MINLLLERFKQKNRTVKFPKEEPKLPLRFKGIPVINRAICSTGCKECVASCPTGAISFDKNNKVVMDIGKCLFCANCLDACKTNAISFSRDYRMSVRKKTDLVLEDGKVFKLAKALEDKTNRIFKRSLRLRHVSAGGCNACELDTNVLNTVVFDLSRFGIQFVASPRHADGLLVSGPVTKNMELALKKTYLAVSNPKIVIAVGACAISGGPYINHSETSNGVESIIPVDLFIPGCPPHPIVILDGILRLLERI